MPVEIKLSELAVGSSAIVRRYPPGSAALLRLREMGVLPGTVVTLVRVAPLGDPIEIRVRGYHLSLRKSEAAHLTVEKVDDAPSP